MRVVAALLATLLLAGCTGGGDEPPDRTIAGELIDGSSYDGSAHQGKITVVNFWASWCAPCRSEMPELIAAYETTRGDGVTFVGINTKDELDKAVAFADNFKVPYPSLFDPPGRLALGFEIAPNAIPQTLILATDGRTVLHFFRAAVLREELIEAIRQAQTGG